MFQTNHTMVNVNDDDIVDNDIIKIKKRDDNCCNVSVKLCTKVGTDSIGEQLVKELASVGVEVLPQRPSLLLDCHQQNFLDSKNSPVGRDNADKHDSANNKIDIIHNNTNDDQISTSTTSSITTVIVSGPSNNSSSFTGTCTDEQHDNEESMTRTCIHTVGTCGELSIEDLFCIGGCVGNDGDEKNNGTHTNVSIQSIIETIYNDPNYVVVWYHTDSRHTHVATLLAREAKKRAIPISIDIEKDRNPNGTTNPHYDELIMLADLVFTNSMTSIVCILDRINRQKKQQYQSQDTTPPAMRTTLASMTHFSCVNAVFETDSNLVYRQPSNPVADFAIQAIQPLFYLTTRLWPTASSVSPLLSNLNDDRRTELIPNCNTNDSWTVNSYKRKQMIVTEGKYGAISVTVGNQHVNRSIILSATKEYEEQTATTYASSSPSKDCYTYTYKDNEKDQCHHCLQVLIDNPYHISVQHQLVKTQRNQFSTDESDQDGNKANKNTNHDGATTSTTTSHDDEDPKFSKQPQEQEMNPLLYNIHTVGVIQNITNVHSFNINHHKNNNTMNQHHQTAEEWEDKKQSPICTVDTTGAGDAFIGAYILASVSSKQQQQQQEEEILSSTMFMTEHQCMQFASWVAGRKVQGYGARTSIPTGADIDTMLGTTMDQVCTSLKHYVGPYNNYKSS